ncbi:hypothetical protein GX48_05749 [Paracoccidioides brasiliensis]|nr:hypothetical protein GX48_05749 [Paracoccidioides brasiliensis]
MVIIQGKTATAARNPGRDSDGVRFRVGTVWRNARTCVSAASGFPYVEPRRRNGFRTGRAVPKQPVVGWHRGPKGDAESKNAPPLLRPFRDG